MKETNKEKAERKKKKEKFQRPHLVIKLLSLIICSYVREPEKERERERERGREEEERE